MFPHSDGKPARPIVSLAHAAATVGADESIDVIAAVSVVTSVFGPVDVAAVSAVFTFRSVDTVEPARSSVIGASEG